MFSAKNMSKTARRAAKLAGLTTVGGYAVMNHTRIVDPETQADDFDTVVIRAYSPSGRKVVDITAWDIWFVETQYQDAPMARVV